MNDLVVAPVPGARTCGRQALADLELGARVRGLLAAAGMTPHDLETVLAAAAGMRAGREPARA